LASLSDKALSAFLPLSRIAQQVQCLQLWGRREKRSQRVGGQPFGPDREAAQPRQPAVTHVDPSANLEISQRRGVDVLASEPRRLVMLRQEATIH
jgi:hypothetical protein